MKTCTTCHQAKPLDEFNRYTRSPDGRQPRCRECARVWYRDNLVRHRANVRARNVAVARELHAAVGRYLTEHPCVDCGIEDLRVLEFDHRPEANKAADVSRLIRAGRPWEEIRAEIDKCDVRCANCHRRKTMERANAWRHTTYLRQATALADQYRSVLCDGHHYQESGTT